MKRVPRMLRMSTSIPQVNIKRRYYAGFVSASTTNTEGFWSYISPSISDALASYPAGGSLWNGSSPLSPNLKGIPNLVEYASLFDLYKVHGIRYEFKPRFQDLNYGQVSSTASAQYASAGYVTYSVDPTPGSQTLSGVYGIDTLNKFLEDSPQAKTVRCDKPFSIYWKPKVSEQYGSGGLRWVRPQWSLLSGDSLKIPHNGFYIMAHNNNFSSTSLPTTHQYDVYITWYISFKGGH